jgi:hypothetical protein
MRMAVWSRFGVERELPGSAGTTAGQMFMNRVQSAWSQAALHGLPGAGSKTCSEDSGEVRIEAGKRPVVPNENGSVTVMRG